MQQKSLPSCQQQLSEARQELRVLKTEIVRAARHTNVMEAARTSHQRHQPFFSNHPSIYQHIKHYDSSSSTTITPNQHSTMPRTPSPIPKRSGTG